MKKKMMQLMALMLSLLLLTACGDSGNVDDGKKDEPALTGLDLVLDQSDDAGKLTVRFFDFVLYEENNSSIRRKTGDAMLLTSPDGKLMLLDTATPAAGPYLSERLREMGITYIDYLVLSHTHADHIGGVPSVLNDIEIGQAYMTADTKDEEGGAYYDKMMFALDTMGVPVTHLWEGDTFMFGEEVEVSVYNPPVDYDFYASPTGVEVRNNSSLALRFVYGESSYLLAGDLYSGGEARLVKAYGDALQSDVIKMNHHGYEANNTLDWARAVKPMVAVATLMKDGSKEMVYKSVGADSYFLYKSGHVAISTPGDGTYKVITELGENQVTTYPKAAE